MVIYYWNNLFRVLWPRVPNLNNINTAADSASHRFGAVAEYFVGCSLGYTKHFHFNTSQLKLCWVSFNQHIQSQIQLYIELFVLLCSTLLHSVGKLKITQILSENSKPFDTIIEIQTNLHVTAQILSHVYRKYTWLG